MINGVKRGTYVEQRFLNGQWVPIHIPVKFDSNRNKYVLDKGPRPSSSTYRKTVYNQRVEERTAREAREALSTSSQSVHLTEVESEEQALRANIEHSSESVMHQLWQQFISSSI